MQDVPTDTATVIAGLQAQIDELRSELARVMPPPTAGDDATAAEPVANRRSLLKLAGATAVGTVASLTVANRAAAEIGYDGTQTVADSVNQRQTASRPGKTAFVFQTVDGQIDNSSFFPGALGGWSYDLDAPNGVYGYSGVNSGTGVVGYAAAANGTGVKGVADVLTAAAVIGLGGGVAVAGTTSGAGTRGGEFSANGPASTGVIGRATGDETAGVVGTGVVGGVFDGTGPTGTGLIAAAISSGARVSATGSEGVGLVGTCFGTSGVGVYGIGGNYGVKGYSEATNGVGGNFGGLAGAVRLGGWQDAAPPSRSIAHERGVIENLTNGDVWYCYEAGTPGKWRKLSGATTAGAFHPLAPGRVYDSREALPSPGALRGGQSRTISVADRRNPTGGAVTAANFVPAGATAVAANVTIVSVVGGGFLACNPGGTTEVTASTINWSAPDQAIANGVILTLNTNRELTVVAGGGTTHFLVDITGYWL